MPTEATTLRTALSQTDGLRIVKQELAKRPKRCRTEVARNICLTLGFLDFRGQPQIAACLKVLRDLDARKVIKLPRGKGGGSTEWQPRRAPEPIPQPVGVPQSASELNDLRIVLVAAEDHEAMCRWNELMISEHSRGLPRLAGAQLKYLVESEFGTLGAVAFSASALRLEDREAWIGWNESQLTRHRNRVVNLSRLIIRPTVQCRNLASMILGKCVRRMPTDFEKRYKYKPWLLETFIDRDHHLGTCFLAANWEKIGATKGRGRNDVTHEASVSVKDILVYPLIPDFREKMGVPSSAGRYLRPRQIHEGLEEDRWVEQEFGEVDLGDKRLNDRLMKIVDDRSRIPGVSYLTACGGKVAAVKGFYRLIDSDSPQVDHDAILSTHRKRTIERCMSQELVLAIQDTTDMNLTSHPKTKGLGYLNANQTGTKSMGIRLHSTLAFTEYGLPLGMLTSKIMAEPKKTKHKREIPNTPIEEKKSFRWLEAHRQVVEVARKTPQTRFLTVADREGDFFELFHDAQAKRSRVGLLVRASHNRVMVGGKKLESLLEQSENRATIEVTIPRQRSKAPKGETPGQQGVSERKAELTVCYSQLELPRPKTALTIENAQPITVWGIFAYEENAPENSKPIQWKLLTTEKVETAEDAAKMLRFYSIRWRIEEYFRILKSGVKLLDHQHESVTALSRVIALDCVLAWRLQLMTLLGRESSNLAADVTFNEWEIRVLKAHNRKLNVWHGEGPMTLQVAMLIIAKIGGYLNRRSDPPPGSKVMWLGFYRFVGDVIGYMLAYEEMGRKPPG
jgi:hypothetical protein